jgi:HAMP domain-containing protein
LSIRAKLMGAIAASMAALALATGALVRASGERALLIAAQQAIAGAGQDFASLERSDVEKLDTTLRALGGYPALVDAFAARDRAKLLALAAPIFSGLRQNHDITHMYFIEPDPSRKVLLRVHRPDQFGDVVHRATLNRAIDSLAIGAGKELGENAFALRVVRPWYGRDGALVGFAELAEEIDHFVARLKQESGDDYGLLIEKVFLDKQAWARSRVGKRNNWDDRPRSVVVNTTTPDEGIVGFDGDVSSIPDDGLVLDEQQRGGKILVRGIVPVRDAAGRRVGGLFVLHDVTQLHASMEEARRGLYLVIAGVAALLALLLIALVNRVVFRRLDLLSRELDVVSGRFAVGDLEVRIPKAREKDELGRYEDALGAFVQRVVGILKEAGRKRTG